ncbi:COG2146 Ferredoxin subunits of nitrite reductase and ring-hydroxylating dioxygenases [Vibrio sp. B1FLJ16]|uniref:nitrite reductase small subunit NirD n=1 Tax=Vibrio sp. B1FLJ16 TaxID=2751178 RepID=UPI0015F7116E|nr:nitrite reductase small subunit NirD [Vibrio sp. B1FLJ16]CAD7820114.1 COG2146 Ferredoxin subunits of nitrite reductase and ring-hydroxylating dioxygenases [Vibrio sp. B1FLJ16]CAE6941876.1 COG2146 Ferredoxin subunits of nitrite reductase and ring-hydroxylating dioxygenases [Vibrio sp. B1FLJ16]
MNTLTSVSLCKLDELIPFVGSIVLLDDEQVALFYIPEHGVYAVQDWDPIGKAYVLSRGIVGDIDGELCVASPLYKQHFCLKTGRCVEDEKYQLKTWKVTIDGGTVCLTTDR